MTDKKWLVRKIIQHSQSAKATGYARAAANIALAKYWGKRDRVLNLPMNGSLSISLASRGATATIAPSQQWYLMLNDQVIAMDSIHGKRFQDYLSLFSDTPYQLNLLLDIPLAAGLASSAAIFAATVLALNDLYQWQLDARQLSILARLGSGSAARSIEKGFVEWHKGIRPDGMDSYATRLGVQWPTLCVGLCIVSDKVKPLASREAMQRTVLTSPLYSAWPSAAREAVDELKKAIYAKDFALLGKIAEQNALAMHATMQSAWPPVVYSTQDTLSLMRKVWWLRDQGAEIYFTQDAGPNLKLLFLNKDKGLVRQHFANIEILEELV